jgi:extradiol dioxygenase family protein
MEQSLPPFHLAVEVRDITEARAFYGGLLTCPEGRSDASWVDFNFFGHQLVCHLSDNYPANAMNPPPTPWMGTPCQCRILA